jgi:hypothetical protein
MQQLWKEDKVSEKTVNNAKKNQFKQVAGKPMGGLFYRHLQNRILADSTLNHDDKIVVYLCFAGRLHI